MSGSRRSARVWRQRWAGPFAPVACVLLAACGGGTPRATTTDHGHAPITAAASTDEPASAGFRAGVGAELPTRRPLLVEARIDDADPAWFYLDTGATGMVISPGFAKTAKMPKLPGVTVHGASAFEAPCRACRRFELGPLVLSDLTFVEIDVGFIGEGGETPVSGIIGADVFQHAVFEVDLAAPTVRICDPEKYKLEGAQWTPMVMTDRGPAIKCRFEAGENKEAEGLFVLDTGGNFTVAFHAPAVEELRLLETRETRPQMSRGVGGMNYGRRGRLKWFEVCGQRVDRAGGREGVGAMFFGEREGVEYEKDMYGMIGAGMLRRFLVVLDYPHKRVALVAREGAPP